MKIELLLGLDTSKLTEAEEALEILREEWRLGNEPTDAAGLVCVLKRAMDACERRGLRWPRVFLLRKGQLSRGEFEPCTTSATVAPASMKFAVPKHGKIPREWLERATEEENERLRKNRPVN